MYFIYGQFDLQETAIILKTDVVFCAIFHVEHIMSSTHIVCGSALLLERWSSYSAKKVISLSSSFNNPTKQLEKESTI